MTETDFQTQEKTKNKIPVVGGTKTYYGPLFTVVQDGRNIVVPVNYFNQPSSWLGTFFTPKNSNWLSRQFNFSKIASPKRLDHANAVLINPGQSLVYVGPEPSKISGEVIFPSEFSDSRKLEVGKTYEIIRNSIPGGERSNWDKKELSETKV